MGRPAFVQEDIRCEQICGELGDVSMRRSRRRAVERGGGNRGDVTQPVCRCDEKIAPREASLEKPRCDDVRTVKGAQNTTTATGRRPVKKVREETDDWGAGVFVVEAATKIRFRGDSSGGARASVFSNGSRPNCRAPSGTRLLLFD